MIPDICGSGVQLISRYGAGIIRKSAVVIPIGLVVQLISR